MGNNCEVGPFAVDDMGAQHSPVPNPLMCFEHTLSYLSGKRSHVKAAMFEGQRVPSAIGWQLDVLSTC